METLVYKLWQLDLKIYVQNPAEYMYNFSKIMFWHLWVSDIQNQRVNGNSFSVYKRILEVGKEEDRGKWYFFLTCVCVCVWFAYVCTWQVCVLLPMGMRVEDWRVRCVSFAIVFCLKPFEQGLSRIWSFLFQPEHLASNRRGLPVSVSHFHLSYGYRDVHHHAQLPLHVFWELRIRSLSYEAGTLSVEPSPLPCTLSIEPSPLPCC